MRSLEVCPFTVLCHDILCFRYNTAAIPFAYLVPKILYSRSSIDGYGPRNNYLVGEVNRVYHSFSKIVFQLLWNAYRQLQ